MTEKDTFLGYKILPAGLYTRQQEASDRRKKQQATQEATQAVARSDRKPSQSEPSHKRRNKL